MRSLFLRYSAIVALLGVAATEAACSGRCTYNVIVETQWNPTSFPREYPEMAHWSPFYAVTHHSSYCMWMQGGMASPGLKEIAETGAGVKFFSEVAPCTASGSCGEPIEISCTPFGGTCSGNGTIEATANYPYFSTASMIAPSPDWFIGVNSWPLCVNSSWVQERETFVNVYDAGTDSGGTFTSPDVPTIPQMPIFSLAQEPKNQSIFFNPTENDILPIAFIMVELVGCDM